MSRHPIPNIRNSLELRAALQPESDRERLRRIRARYICLCVAILAVKNRLPRLRHISLCVAVLAVKKKLLADAEKRKDSETV